MFTILHVLFGRSAAGAWLYTSFKFAPTAPRLSGARVGRKFLAPKLSRNRAISFSRRSAGCLERFLSSTRSNCVPENHASLQSRVPLLRKCKFTAPSFTTTKVGVP